MIKITISILTIFSLFFATAQEGNWCGTDKQMEALFDANPSMKSEMDEHIRRLRSEGVDISERADDYIIPVVVHILHSNSDGNISYEQVISGIDQLNEDFNRENLDAGDTRNSDDAPFLSEASSMGIRFELAKIDPDGNCTNGIERRDVGSMSYNADNSAKHFSSGGLDAWNRNFYFNVWIVNSIDSDGAGVTLGYAEFPYGGGSSNYGVIIRHDAYGTVGTASGDRTFTHEVGHCLGLLHTFQGGCHADACDDNGDYCCDTPPVDEPQWSCATTQNTCNDIPVGDFYGFDAFDQFENYMSYSPCQNMYTKNQTEIVIGNLTSIGFLVNLVDPSNNLAAGVGLPEVLCKADFFAHNPIVCEGNELQFFDASYSNVTERLWTFEGGTPSTSTEINPLVTYNTPGNYSVTLEVTDGISTEITTMENYVLIMPVPGTSLPYSENFETIESIPDNDRFVIINEDADEPWKLHDTIGYSGSHSIWLKNRGVSSRALDSFISGTIDLSEVDPDEDMIFTFKYAYKRRNSGTDEWLRFYISNDCGETWILRKNISGDDLGPEIQNSSYYPENNSEWYPVTISNINATYYTADFRYKFEFLNDNGNNIFIDDINMYSESMVSIDEEKETMVTAVYPNPSNSDISIRLTLAESDQVDLTILNSLGQEIDLIYSGQLVTGENIIPYSVSALPKGVYYIKIINAAGNASTIRFIKN